MSAPAARRPQISREFIEEHRRRRYVEASAELLHEFGRRGSTVTNIVRLAGTARNSFYEVFDSAEDCIAHGIGLAGRELFATTTPERAGRHWLIEVRAAIAGFYRAVASAPLTAELYLLHSAASRRPEGREAAREGGGRFAALLARGRAEAQATGRPVPPALLEECLSRAIVSLAAARVRSPGLEALPGEAEPMALLAGGYFIGPRRAAEALAGHALR